MRTIASISVWLLIVLVCFAGTLISCDNGDEGRQSDDVTINSAPPSQPGGTSQASDSAPATAETKTPPAEGAVQESGSTLVSGEDVYKAASCAMCHGKDLKGSKLAPALAGLEEFWTTETLAMYLNDPVSYTATDQRLRDSKGKYSVTMPAWKQTGLGEEDKLLMVEWLLAQD